MVYGIIVTLDHAFCPEHTATNRGTVNTACKRLLPLRTRYITVIISATIGSKVDG